MEIQSTHIIKIIKQVCVFICCDLHCLVFGYMSFPVNAVVFVNPMVTKFWPKVSKSHLFAEELVFFRHWCNDSSLAPRLLDQNVTKACVMTCSDICILIYDIKNSSPPPQVLPISIGNTMKTVPRVPAK